GPRGVRVLGLWIAGVPETLSPAKLAAVNSNLRLDDAAFQGLLDQLAAMRMLRRSPRLAEIADTAAFLASDPAAGLTATCGNVTGGIFASGATGGGPATPACPASGRQEGEPWAGRSVATTDAAGLLLARPGRAAFRWPSPAGEPRMPWWRSGRAR